MKFDYCIPHFKIRYKIIKNLMIPYPHLIAQGISIFGNFEIVINNPFLIEDEVYKFIKRSGVK